MNPNRPTALAAALLALAAAGCSTTHGPLAPQDSTKFTLSNTHRFAALDPASEAAVDCTGLQAGLLADGRLEVVANLRNRQTRPFRVQIRSVFLDGKGLPATQGGAWRSLQIGPGATEVVRLAAADPSAVTYTIEVREAR